MLHGALLVSRVIYVPADTRWRWLKPFRLLGPPAPPFPPLLSRLLACPFSLVSLLIFLSVLIHGLRCLRRRNPNKSIFNAMRRAPPPPSALLTCSSPPGLSLRSDCSPALLGSKCTVSVKGLSLISGPDRAQLDLGLTRFEYLTNSRSAHII